MNIGLVICCIILSIYIISYIIKNEKKRDNIFLKMAFITLFVILIVRNPYSDMPEYLKYFHAFHKMSIDQIMRFDLEPFFKLLTTLIGYIWLEDRFFILIIDIITLIGPYCFIKRYSKNYLLSLLLFVAIGSFSIQFYGLRQAIAVSIILFSIKYIEERKFFKFLSLIIIAALFHKSALIFLPMYFLTKINIKYQIALFPIVFIVAAIFKKQLCDFLCKVFYSNYIGGYHNVQGEGYGKLMLFILLLFFYFALCSSKKYLEKNVEDEKYKNIKNILITLSFATIIIQLLSTQISIMTRLTYYFSISFIILPINAIIDLKNERLKKIIIILTVIIILVYLCFIHPISGYSIVFNTT